MRPLLIILALFVMLYAFFGIETEREHENIFYITLKERFCMIEASLCVKSNRGFCAGLFTLEFDKAYVYSYSSNEIPLNFTAKPRENKINILFDGHENFYSDGVLVRFYFTRKDGMKSGSLKEINITLKCLKLLCLDGKNINEALFYTEKINTEGEIYEKYENKRIKRNNCNIAYYKRYINACVYRICKRGIAHACGK